MLRLFRLLRWSILSLFQESIWEEQVDINRRRAEREAAERERRARLAPDLLVKLEDYFCDKVCSNGKPLEFKLGDAPLGEDCVLVSGPGPIDYGWIVPAELHKSWKSGYYILTSGGGSQKVSEAKLMKTVTRIFAG